MKLVSMRFRSPLLLNLSEKENNLHNLTFFQVFRPALPATYLLLNWSKKPDFQFDVSIFEHNRDANDLLI